MAQICRICSHKNRLQIDKEIVTNGNLTKISKKYDVSYSSLYSHAQNHISRQLAKAWSIRNYQNP